MAPKWRTVDEYLAGVAGDQQAALAFLRRTIRAAVPDAEEGFSYGMPAVFWKGKAVAGYFAFQNHLSYFPMSGRVVAGLAKDLAGYETNKGTIRFTPDKPLPAALVKKLVKARLTELAGKDAKNPAKTPTKKASRFDPAVEAFLQELDHPLKWEYVAVRRFLVSLDPSIQEGLKWNAPSFRTADYFATLFTRSTDRVQLIFHTGAKKKGISMKDKISDTNDLVQWLAPDRCMVTLGTPKEWKANRKAFQALVKAWIREL